MAEEVGYLFLQAACHNTLAIILGDQGDLRGARGHYEASSYLNRRIGHRRNAALAELNLGYNDVLQGRVDAALDRYQEILPTFKELDDSRGMAWTSVRMAEVRLLQGRGVEAAALANAGRGLFETMGAEGDVAVAVKLLARARRLEGDYQVARDLYHQALAAFQESGNRQMTVATLLELVELELDYGDAVAAAGHLDEASQIELDTTDREQHYGLVAARARVACAGEGPVGLDAHRVVLEAALVDAEGSGWVLAAGKLRLALAVLELAAGDVERGLEHARTVRDLARELGLGWYEELAVAVLGSVGRG